MMLTKTFAIALSIFALMAHAAPEDAVPFSPGGIDMPTPPTRDMPRPAGPQGTSVTVTVGSDGACDYPNISQAAVFAAAADQLNVHVARNVALTSTQLITARNIALYGGYDDCSDASPSGHTELDGSGFSGSVLWAIADYSGSGSYRLDLVDIDIVHATATGTTRGGGMTIDGPFRVALTDSQVQHNTTPYSGGGILIIGEAGAGATDSRTSLWLTHDSIVSNNTAGDGGGGIACRGQVRVNSEQSQIAVNEAATAGGGIHSEDCYVVLFGHSIFEGVLLNDVTNPAGRGGGVYADGGTVWVVGGSGRPSQVISNSASSGGGVYVESADFYAYDATITNNTASSRGGGVYASHSDTVIVRWREGSSCHDTLRCSQLSNNTVTGTGIGAGGGGLWADFGTTLIAGTFVEGNHVAAGRGMAILVQGAVGTNGGFDLNGIRIMGSVVAGNNPGGGSVAGDSSIVHLQDSSGAIGFTTFAANAEVPRIVYTPTVGSTIYPIDLYGSIFDATSGLSADPGSDGAIPAGDCNRVHEMTSLFAQNSTRSTIAPANLGNPGGGDYGLSVASSLIDWCDASFNYYSGLSADGGPRPYDDPDWLPLHGNYDLGGLERHPNDLIFADGFD